MATKSKPKSTQLNSVNEELARLARAGAEREAKSAGGGQFFSFKGGRLSFDGGDLPGNSVRVIVLDSVLENHFYDRDYDENNPASPVCFAYGTDEDDIAPHADSTAPQSDLCANCPHNEWGSAEKGRGKACKNIRRLMVISEDSLEDFDNAKVAYMKIPVTSVKAWAGYVRDLYSKTKNPPICFVTEVKVVAGSPFFVEFKSVDVIEDSATLAALFQKRDENQDTFLAPYQAPAEKPEPVRRGPGKIGKPAAIPAKNVAKRR